MFRLYFPGATGSLQMPRVNLSVMSIFSTSSVMGPQSLPSPVGWVGLAGVLSNSSPTLDLITATYPGSTSATFTTLTSNRFGLM